MFLIRINVFFSFFLSYICLKLIFEIEEDINTQDVIVYAAGFYYILFPFSFISLSF